MGRSRDAPNVDDGAVVLVHPTCGPTQGDDIPGDVRYKTYEVLKSELGDDTIQGVPALQHAHGRAPRGPAAHADPQELRLHPLHHRARHGRLEEQPRRRGLLRGLRRPGPGQVDLRGAGRPVRPEPDVMYTEEKGYVTADVAEAEGLTPKKLSGTKFCKMLRAGEDIPEWFAFKSVVQVLRDAQK